MSYYGPFWQYTTDEKKWVLLKRFSVFYHIQGLDPLAKAVYIHPWSQPFYHSPIFYDRSHFFQKKKKKKDIVNVIIIT